MKQFFTSKEEYIAVLQTEMETILRYYYNPNTGATGHYNTAASVLAERIKELKEHT
jgi:ribosomal protein S15P/S13E